MQYMSAKEASVKWKVSQRRVSTLCAEGRIHGASRVGNMWLIPQETEKPLDGRVVRNALKLEMPLKPFIKWAGGKGQLLEQIRSKYPSDLGGKITKYAEPFVGGGAVLFDILSRNDMKEVCISDVNRELIHTYISIRDNLDEMICFLQALACEYLNANEEERKKLYYTSRERFNALKAKGSKAVELAALFIFLNRTCFNGLYRVNSRGAFNVPQGSYKNPTICDTQNLQAVSEKLQGVIIGCADYKQSKQFIDEHTLVYFDPPYRPLTATSSFTSYAEHNFGDKEQTELASFIDELSERGAFIIASNSDPKSIDTEDDFFDRLYARHNITRVSASRNINSVGTSRGKISELLITNY